MNKAGKRSLAAAREAAGILSGEITEGFVVHVPDEVNVRAIRKKLGMTRQAFAARYGFKADTVKDWELKRRRPDQPARVLLKVIDHEPEAVERALAKA